VPELNGPVLVQRMHIELVPSVILWIAAGEKRTDIQLLGCQEVGPQALQMHALGCSVLDSAIELVHCLTGFRFTSALPRRGQTCCQKVFTKPSWQGMWELTW
jgi:hypothetical protein